MPEQFGPSQMFGRYLLIKRLGRGGMGEVWEARDTNEDGHGQIALKLLSAEAVQDPQLRERFRRESRLAKQIHHPHVLPVYGSGVINGTPYIAMRLVDGTNLASVVTRGPLSPDPAVSIIEQMGAALDTAHAMGLRHRDVKPSNIVLEPGARNGDYHASLIDWGIAQLVDTSGAPPVTRVGQIPGTPPYIAPERLKAEMTSDHRADVYALAVVLYECLAGGPPFVGKKENVLTAQIDDEPPPLPDHLPSALRAVVATGLAKDPAHRYQSAGELAVAARRALDTAGEVPSRWHVPPVVQGGAVGALVALVLLLTGLTDQMLVLPALTAVGVLGRFALFGPSGRTGSARRSPRPSGPTGEAEPGGFSPSRSSSGGSSHSQ